jgi:hypothetical protein
METGAVRSAGASLGNTILTASLVRGWSCRHGYDTKMPIRVETGIMAGIGERTIEA